MQTACRFNQKAIFVPILPKLLPAGLPVKQPSDQMNISRLAASYISVQTRFRTVTGKLQGLAIPLRRFHSHYRNAVSEYPNIHQ